MSRTVRMFNCQPLGDDGDGGEGTTYLVADFQIDCQSKEYFQGGRGLWSWKRIAKISLYTWVVGIPLVIGPSIEL